MKNERNIAFGICPITWRNDDMPWIGEENNFRQLLSDAKLAGFDYTEIGGFFPNDETINYELKLREMGIAGQWFSSFILQDGIEKTKQEFTEFCKHLQKVNANIAVICESSKEIYSSDETSIYYEQPTLSQSELQTLANGLNELGKIAKAYSLKIAYHSHMGTVIQTKADVDQLMELTDPDLVGLLFDTGHALIADGDPMPLLKKYLERITHVHFKDINFSKLEKANKEQLTFRRSVLDSVFTVPGVGNINFEPIYKALVNADYKGFIMVEAEQDPKKANPLEMAQTAYDYIENHLIKNNK